MQRMIFFCCIVILYIVPLFSATPVFETHRFDNGADFILPYRFYQPAAGETGKKYPLILFLHGAGDWGTNNSSQLANFPYHFLDSANGSAYPCYVIAPQCTEESPWSWFPDYPEVNTLPTATKSTGQVLALIDTLLESDTVDIDRNRLYVAGFSLGGEGAFDIITRAPDLFAAAVPVCGIADTAKAALMGNTPLWIFHGDNDDVNSVTYSRMIVDALTKIGKPPKYTEYAGMDHYVWSKAFKEPDLLPWLFSQNKGVISLSHDMNMQSKCSSRCIVSCYGTKVKISWPDKNAAPDLVEYFTLDGRCLFSKVIPHTGSSSAVLSSGPVLAGISARIIRCSRLNRPLFAECKIVTSFD